MNHNKRIPNECTSSTIHGFYLYVLREKKELHKNKKKKKKLHKNYKMKCYTYY